MNYIFKFPDIGEGIHEGRIVKWYVNKGQSIRSGDPVVKMETDKVVTDIPSPRDGTIVSRHGSEGELVNVGDALVEIALLGESEQTASSETKASHVAIVEEKGFGVVGKLEVAGDSAYLPVSEEGRLIRSDGVAGLKKKVLATPTARAMAKDMGVDINAISGSGPAGRVVKNDILRAVDGSSKIPIPKSAGEQLPELESPAVTLEPLTQIRKTIARNMIRSKQSAAHMTVFEQVEVDRLVDLRKRLNDKLSEKEMRLTYLPFILKAVGAALTQYPRLNSQMDMEKEQLIIHHDVHISIAIDTPDGLMVPVVRDVNRKGLLALASEMAVLAHKAQLRTLQLADFQGGTFTVTNYGAIGGTYGVPVINYPQAAILGIGRIMKSPVVRGDQLAIGYLMPLSLSVDHRIVDGAESARFIRRVMDFLSEPDSLLLV